MAFETATLPGYTGLPSAGVAIARTTGTLTGVRVTGPFLARSKTSVDSVKDGWLIQREDGYMIGVEAHDMEGRFKVLPVDFVDTVALQANGQEGVAYSQGVVPPANGELAPTSAALTFGSVYDGLTLHLTNPAAVTLDGTPALLSPRWSYFEITYGWADGKSVVQRYAMSVLPAV